MGVVYRAQDRLTGEQIALKHVHVSENAELDFRMALAQEFRTLASLRHPYIVSVLDYGFDDTGQPFFTMEYLQNAQTIQDYGINLSFDKQVHLLYQLVQALHYLHRRGIIHRDIKPDNVLIVDGGVKLLDFGLAVAREQLKDNEENTAGTLAYMSPELLQAYPASEQSDMYAVAVIAYELLNGKHPLMGETVTETIRNVLTVMPDTESLAIPEWIKELLRRSLEKDPQQRYSNTQEILDLFAQHNVTEPNVSLRESYLKAAAFVGREQELGQLKLSLHALIHERKGSAWLIGGESGVGKTRLMDELRIYALVEGALVLRGQSVTESTASYGAWHDVLRYLVLDAKLSTHEIGVLKQVVPNFVSEKIFEPLSDSQNAQMYLLNTIESLLNQHKRPIVILLEDLQWAQEDLAILKRLSASIERLPVLLVANYRDDERPNLPNELPQMQQLKLKRFSPEEIAQLSQSIIGTQHYGVVDLLERETEGNPFFIVEVVRALAEDAGSLEQIGLKTLPPMVFAHGIKTLVNRRLTRVPKANYPLLQLAAIAGREIDPALLAKLAPQVNINRWLTTCASAAVLEVRDNRWSFAHDKLREGVIDTLSDKSELHRQVAQAIEALYGESRAASLAYHYAQAGDTQQEAHYQLLPDVIA